MHVVLDSMVWDESFGKSRNSVFPHTYGDFYLRGLVRTFFTMGLDQGHVVFPSPPTCFGVSVTLNLEEVSKDRDTLLPRRPFCS